MPSVGLHTIYNVKATSIRGFFYPQGWVNSVIPRFYRRCRLKCNRAPYSVLVEINKNDPRMITNQHGKGSLCFSFQKRVCTNIPDHQRICTNILACTNIPEAGILLHAGQEIAKTGRCVLRSQAYHKALKCERKIFFMTNPYLF